MKRRPILTFIIDKEGNCTSSDRTDPDLLKLSKSMALITSEFEKLSLELEEITGKESFPQEGWIFVGKEVVAVVKNGGYQAEVFGDIPESLKEILK
ncbi:MAG: hypothetical protein N2445_04190 [Acidobacteria bacterium]|nr:hypothetical protein [Acidobacteriota bacterium]